MKLYFIKKGHPKENKEVEEFVVEKLKSIGYTEDLINSHPRTVRGDDCIIFYNENSWSTTMDNGYIGELLKLANEQKILVYLVYRSCLGYGIYKCNNIGGHYQGVSNSRPFAESELKSFLNAIKKELRISEGSSESFYYEPSAETKIDQKQTVADFDRRLLLLLC